MIAIITFIVANVVSSDDDKSAFDMRLHSSADRALINYYRGVPWNPTVNVDLATPRETGAFDMNGASLLSGRATGFWYFANQLTWTLVSELVGIQMVFLLTPGAVHSVLWATTCSVDELGSIPFIFAEHDSMTGRKETGKQCDNTNWL